MQQKTDFSGIFQLNGEVFSTEKRLLMIYNKKMSNNAVFNASVCIIGILILTIHVVNLLTKKERRKDENVLLNFFIFTTLHFATYLAFTLIKAYSVTGDAYIIAFYTVFYMMNNLEVFLLFRYAHAYMGIEGRKGKAISLLNVALFGVFALLDVINAFTGIFFTAEGGEYVRSKTMILCQGYQFVMLVAIFLVAVTNKKLNLREKIAFCLYCVLPLGAIILQNIFKGYAIAYLSIIVAIEVLFLFLNVQKNIDLAKEEEKNKEARIKIMLSQIQPHFIYNSLSSISTLIPLDPEKAQSALDDFTEYLRMNLSSLTEVRCVSFEDELKHIKTYVSLEKMRFGDRLKVVYDVKTTHFMLPPLTIQPIVENAIKHGILKKLEGGTLSVKTYETDKSCMVEIADDGVGFNMADVDFDANKHFGLKNIQYRLSKMCGADLAFKSEPGVGTRVTVTFRKENAK